MRAHTSHANGLLAFVLLRVVSWERSADDGARAVELVVLAALLVAVVEAADVMVDIRSSSSLLSIWWPPPEKPLLV